MAWNDYNRVAGPDCTVMCNLINTRDRRDVENGEDLSGGRKILKTCMVITYSRLWINRIRLPILLVVS